MEWQRVVIVVSLCGLIILSLDFFISIIFIIGVKPDKSVENVKLFEDYIVQYNKSYKNDAEEYNKRFELFQKSLEYIEKMNSLRSSQESAFYGLTQFSDLSEDEFLQQTLPIKLPLQDQEHTKGSAHSQYTMNSINRNHVKRMIDIPSKFDWRDKGVIGPVQSQEPCQACWAFTTIGIIESMYAIKTGTLYSLSVQELIDCVSYYGCEHGSDIYKTLSWLKSRNISIVSENAYPLTRKTDTCKLSEVSAETLRVTVTSFVRKSFVNNECHLLKLLANHGPVAAYVNAQNWKNYLGGIIQDNCDGSVFSMTHAIQIVGYDTTEETPCYYIVKNSWGSNFGEDGYIRLAIGKNICGIANHIVWLDVV